ncbi:DNA polymerase alpha subunit B [Monomorium pharaonis]|uniref:DNA polymerase alpha subunit B n=1 Tax=Monomorium pharaonis TaxID=307658 RepID=UPI00063F870D|nr:DNA polymerase alpha subunit B [Monomorium pharaonis]
MESEFRQKEMLRDMFEGLGCEIKSDTTLDKCFELCKKYLDGRIDGALPELWVTFCIENNLEFDLTIDNLNKMEQAVLMKGYHRDQSPPVAVEKTKRERNENDDTHDVLVMYGCAEPGPGPGPGPSKRVKLDPTEDVKLAFDSQHTDLNVSMPHNTTDKGEKILLSLGRSSADSWKRTNNYNVTIMKATESLTHLPSDAKFMYQMLSQEGESRTYLTHTFGKKLFDTWRVMSRDELTGHEMHYVRYIRKPSQTKFRTFGRINTKKGSTNTVILEGSTRRRGTSTADTIELDFRLKQYSVFPGQIVAVEATNPVGDTLYVNELFTKSYTPVANPPRITSSINIYVAAGPFTGSNNLDYQPLWDLMDKVASDEPHVLILIGPFLEYTHNKIQEYNIFDNIMYQNFVEEIFMKIMKKTRSSTQVILVASNRDVHHEPVYPTPEYRIYSQKFHNISNLKMMPDPCILDVDGFKIGITSVDIIKHIAKEEISNMSGDKLGRIADHVIGQNTFYPMYPPAEDLNLDTELWEKHTFFNQQPNLLILPSDLRYYCKIINECMVLNPERMHKNVYAKLSVTSKNGGPWSCNSNISYEIVKV